MSTGTRTWFIKHLEKEGSRAMPKNSNTPRFQMEAHIGEDNRNSNNSWHFLSTDSVPHPVLVAYHQRDSLIFTPTYEWGTIKSHILFKWGKPHRDSVPLGIQIQVIWLWDPMLQPTSASRDGDCNHCVYETPGIVRAPQSFQCIRSLNSQGEFSQMSKVRCPNKATHDKQPEGHLISRAPRKAVCAPDAPPPLLLRCSVYRVPSREALPGPVPLDAQPFGVKRQTFFSGHLCDIVGKYSQCWLTEKVTMNLMTVRVLIIRASASNWKIKILKKQPSHQRQIQGCFVISFLLLGNPFRLLYSKTLQWFSDMIRGFFLQRTIIIQETFKDLTTSWHRRRSLFMH